MNPKEQIDINVSEMALQTSVDMAKKNSKFQFHEDHFFIYSSLQLMQQHFLYIVVEPCGDV